MKRYIWLGVLAVLSSPQAQAINQEIRALFQPDSSRPDKNTFVNKTPNSGYCATYPGQCESHGMFSIELPVRFRSTRYLDLFDWAAVKAPANLRRLTVTNSQTQETQSLEIRITGMGSKYVLSHPAVRLAGGNNALEGHSRLWVTGNWVQGIPAPCWHSGVGAYEADSWRFFWKTTQEAHCFKVPAYHIPSMYFDKLDITYELRTPNPLTMSTGRYTGSLTYSLGPGRDFDMGKLFQPDDSSLTLDFVLDVQHTLKVDIPPGGNHIALEPQGGWQRWLDSGRKPVRLFRDQIFHISASSKFTMKLECEHSLGSGSGCAIMDRQSGFAGPVAVSVSLPNGLTDSAGQPVRRKLLGRETSGTFQPEHYIERKPGTLHFEIGEQDTDWLIKHATDKPYRGNITVIWDSEVG
ncbi:hypothetical protein ACI514_01355 [Pseudomonas sp. M20]|jgi:hypothetical protein|uniref:hypothetical protein n=1 Tax=unclassified Pseudomonas TaxID=196821 RepID=UPI00131F65E0|nr:hypothetical protein [Pseudomonas sp. R84]QHC97466.1 hypothetical protein PspR84_23445 [Pseudomonas sp. R84]